MNEMKKRFFFLNPSYKGSYLASDMMVEDELHELYKLVECDTIDIIKRCIGGKLYALIIDDNGKICEEEKMVSALTVCDDTLPPAIFNTGENDILEILVGNILIAGLPDDEGELTPLTDEDVKNIKNNLLISTLEDSSQLACLVLTYPLPNYFG